MSEYMEKSKITKSGQKNRLKSRGGGKTVNQQNRNLSFKLDGYREIIQKKPIPCDEDFDEVGELFEDDVHEGATFQKIAADAYLYDERMILIWDSENEKYMDSRGSEVDLTTLAPSDGHTLVVGMGEMGKITRPNDTIMTSHASPCLILVIKRTDSVYMAHIFAGNKQDDIDYIIRGLQPSDHVTLATSVNPLEEQIITKKERHFEEYLIQKDRRIALNHHLTELSGSRKIASYKYHSNMENASATLTGGVVAHKDDSEPEELSRMAYQRSKKADEKYRMRSPVSIKTRFSNVENGDEYDMSGIIQRNRIYKGPTREKGDGFDEDEMYRYFSSSATARRLEEEIEANGYSYKGDSGSQSFANTDVKQKEIYISKVRDSKRAALGFVYELMNAKNGDRLAKVQELFHKEKTVANAIKYAEGILRIEAEAVFMRTMVALEADLCDVLVNKKYIDIVRGEGSESEKVELIFDEMCQHGTIGVDKDSAVLYYIKQFMEYNDYKPDES